MELKLQKWGNSVGVRLPISLLKGAGFKEGMTVEATCEEGSVVLKDTKCKRKYTLKELVDKITPENLHPYTDWGPAIGNERFWEGE